MSKKIRENTQVVYIIVEYSSTSWYDDSVITEYDHGRFIMARPKKNGTYLNVCIESSIYDRLTRFSEEAGQPKTVAVERALTAYLDDYDQKQEKLREMEIHHINKGRG